MLVSMSTSPWGNLGPDNPNFLIKQCADDHVTPLTSSRRHDTSARTTHETFKRTFIEHRVYNNRSLKNEGVCIHAIAEHNPCLSANSCSVHKKNQNPVVDKKKKGCNSGLRVIKKTTAGWKPKKSAQNSVKSFRVEGSCRTG